ncbi:MAG: TetR/AcrR family transcriptional regulator [Oscillibacter sp.]|nr:TetR/AcrR family transcriptional regulator [Oscillibacter sp.]
MCKETFLRLPEEKRTRILNAAWDEFTTVSFANASINRIIRAAGIPRGSFYQYFEDKDDLFHYLMAQMSEHLNAHYKRLLREADGNLFRSALMNYDRFQSERATLPFDRFISLARINPGMDLEALGRGYHPDKSKMIADFLTEIDKSPFRRQDTPFLTNVCCMVGMCLFGLLMDSMLNPGREAENRQELLEALDILRRGSYSEEALRDAESIDETPLRDAESADETPPRPETMEDITKGGPM